MLVRWPVDVLLVEARALFCFRATESGRLRRCCFCPTLDETMAPLRLILCRCRYCRLYESTSFLPGLVRAKWTPRSSARQCCCSLEGTRIDGLAPAAPLSAESGVSDATRREITFAAADRLVPVAITWARHWQRLRRAYEARKRTAATNISDRRGCQGLIMKIAHAFRKLAYRT